MAVLNPRRARLLAAIRTQGGLWTTGRVQVLYRALGAPKRTTAAGDLAFLAARGLLAERGPVNDRRYLPAGGSR
jgi:hypothetical protein